MLCAGRDAMEEFNMLHDPKDIPWYTPDTVLGWVWNYAHQVELFRHPGHLYGVMTFIIQ